MPTIDKPVVLGGEPAITLDQEEACRWPIVEQEEVDAVTEVTRSGQWSTNPIADELAEEFAAYIGVTYALPHNSGTSALHACMFAMDLGPGDEVISSANNYWATTMPILNVGAIPVFADVDPVFLNLDPEDVESKITPRTKAIVTCHRGGMPCDMDSLTHLSGKYDVKLIEDASQAHGAIFQGKKVGAWGDVAGFSLQTTKLMPAGEAGIFVTNEREFFERAVLLGHYERIKHLDNKELHRFQNTSYGFKHRISPLNAALGKVSLSKLDKRNTLRNQGIRYLYNRFMEIPGIVPPSIPGHVQPVYYLPAFVFYEPENFNGLPVDQFVDVMQAEGAIIESGTKLRHQGGLHTQALFTERKHWAFEHPANLDSVKSVSYGQGTLPVTEDFSVNRITLPLFPSPTEELLDQYVEAFRKVSLHSRELCKLFQSGQHRVY